MSRSLAAGFFQDLPDCPGQSRFGALAFRSLVDTVLLYNALSHASTLKLNPLVRADLLFGFFFSYDLLRERGDWRPRSLKGASSCRDWALVVVS